MKYLSIEGIVGSGKSTLLDYIMKHQTNVSCFQEPVSNFQEYHSKYSGVLHDPLKNSYEKPLSDASIAQLHIIDTSEKHYAKSNLLSKNNIIITERSALSPLFFISCHRNLNVFSGFVADYLTDYWSKILVCNPKILQPDSYIFLDIEPALCQERIKIRSRMREEHCTLSYQEMLYKL